MLKELLYGLLSITMIISVTGLLGWIGITLGMWLSLIN